MIHLNLSEARRLALSQQGLLFTPSFPTGEVGVLACLEQLGYLQIDTISVIQRSHEHTLWTRIPDYQDHHLSQLVQEKQVFEYWSHAASFLPMRDFRFSLPNKHALASGQKKHWHDREEKVLTYVFDRIVSEGPLQSKDFTQPRKNISQWWDWKPTKRALEQLFMEGKLMVAGRRNFQKVYDLTERVLPSGVDTNMPTEGEMARYLIRYYLEGHGLAQEGEFTHLRKQWKKAVRKALLEMEEAGELIRLSLPTSAIPWFVLANMMDQLPSSSGNKKLHFLSPFDNAIIQRNRVQQLFEFAYQIECYVPEAKREYGYFSLPILWGEELVGRIDIKADRKQKTLLIQHLWIERDIADQAHFLQAFGQKIWELAKVHESESIVLHHCHPHPWREEIEAETLRPS